MSSERLVTGSYGWISMIQTQTALSGGASDCFVFLDAEIYMDRVKAPEIMCDLQTAGRLAPAALSGHTPALPPHNVLADG